jgi:tRNA(Ile)-lysidine synthase
MVLLHLLQELAPRHRWRLTVAHLNHQLRGRSSEADERLVRRTGARLKLPVVAARADVRQFARAQKLSLEMAARKLRHDFLAAAAARRRIPTIALAHHADDQLELFFLRLLRGSGGEGLAGMKWQAPSPSDPAIAVVRPLLDRPKSVLRGFAVEQGIRHREDASNTLLDVQRNRVRHELLPLLRRSYQTALDRTIARVMDIVGAEAEFAAEAAREWLRGRRKAKVQKLKSKVREGEGEGVGPSPTVQGRQRRRGDRAGGSFEALPVAVQLCCVGLQLLDQGIAPDYELVEELRLTAERPVAIPLAQVSGEVPSLHYAVRDRSGLAHLRAAEPKGFRAGSVEVELEGRAGEVEFGGARIWWRISGKKGAKLVKAAVGREYFDADKVGPAVQLRYWRGGDRFQPIGMACPVKLQDFFTNQKVPRAQRHQLIVAATLAGEVFWVEGMRISERFKLTGRTIRRLQWCWKRL